MKEKRTRIQMYYEILVAIQDSIDTTTAIQLRTGLSYYPTKEFVSNLKQFGLITTNPIKITNKGCVCVTAYRHYLTELEKIDIFFTSGSWESTKPQKESSTEKIKQLQQVINTLKAIIQEFEK